MVLATYNFNRVLTHRKTETVIRSMERANRPVNYLRGLRLGTYILRNYLVSRDLLEYG